MSNAAWPIALGAVAVLAWGAGSAAAECRAVAGGQRHSEALDADGTVWAWRDSRDGQLGDGTSAPSNVPVQVHDSTNQGYLDLGSCSTRVAVDVRPEGCPNPLNCNANGVIPVAIAGTEVLDPDPASMLLAGVPAEGWSFVDVATPDDDGEDPVDCYDCAALGPDGTLDLRLLFDSQAVCEALGSPGNGECVLATLTGSFPEETGDGEVNGVDSVRIGCR